jgi:hypothetical protein
LAQTKSRRTWRPAAAGLKIDCFRNSPAPVAKIYFEVTEKDSPNPYANAKNKENVARETQVLAPG